MFATPPAVSVVRDRTWGGDHIRSLPWPIFREDLERLSYAPLRQYSLLNLYSACCASSL